MESPTKAYDDIESSLLGFISGLPKLVLPKQAGKAHLVQLLIYETEQLEATSSVAQHVHRTNRMGMGINVTVIGQGTGFQGFGSKYAAAVSGAYSIMYCMFHDSVKCSFISFSSFKISITRTSSR